MTKETNKTADAHQARVQHVCAYEAARLGRISGGILARLIATITVARAWEVDVKSATTLTAYVEAGGAEGTYRVARRIVGLIEKPTISPEGIKAYRESVDKAHANSAAPTDEIAAVETALYALKGDTGWTKFADGMAGKGGNNTPSKPEATPNATAAAIEAALQDGDNATPEKAEQAGARAAATVEAGYTGDAMKAVLAFVEHCSLDQLDTLQTAINERMADEADTAATGTDG